MQGLSSRKDRVVTGCWLDNGASSHDPHPVRCAGLPSPQGERANSFSSPPCIGMRAVLLSLSPPVREGDGAPLGAPLFVRWRPRQRDAAPRGAPSGDFSARAALFGFRLPGRPSASSSRAVVVPPGGAPCRSGCGAANPARGRRSRSRIGSRRDAPLVARDAHIIRACARAGIQTRRKISIWLKCRGNSLPPARLIRVSFAAALAIFLRSCPRQRASGVFLRPGESGDARRQARGFERL
jgi:hypothetical protein